MLILWPIAADLIAGMLSTHLKWQAVQGGQWILWHKEEPLALIQKLSPTSFECTVGDSSIRTTNLIDAKASAVAEAIVWITSEDRIQTHC